MAKFVELQGSDGRTRNVNVDAVACVIGPSGTNKAPTVQLVTGESFDAAHTVEEVLNRLSG